MKSVKTTFIKTCLRQFLVEQKGSVMVEVLVVMPALAWAFAGLFTYWDSYRSINTVQKASYTISDLVSRQQSAIDDNFIRGMRDTLNYMLDADQASKIRVTSYRWSAVHDRYEVIFSRSPDEALPALATGDLALLTSRLPIMSDGDSAVLVEVEVPYAPPLHEWLSPTTIKQFIVTRPRFLPKICHADVSCA